MVKWYGLVSTLTVAQDIRFVLYPPLSPGTFVNSYFWQYQNKIYRGLG